MTAAEINPFIRFAGEITYNPEQSELVALDCRLLYVTRGCGDLHLNGRAFSVQPGAVVYIRPGVPYKFTSEELGIISVNFDMHQARRDVVTVMSKIAPELYSTELCGFEPIDDCRSFNEYIFLEKATLLEKSLRELVEEYRYRRPFYNERGSAMLKSLLLEISRQMTTESLGRSIGDVISYINENYKRRLTNSDLAALVGYHEYHLNRLLKRELGVTMHKYVLRLRVAEAERLLLLSDMPIADIAESVGFENATHFSSQFKLISGISPASYRKKYKESV